MSTLVTGAFGCIGAWVVRGLLARGERPVVFDLGDDPWRMRMIVGPDVAGRIVAVRGDIADREAVVRVVKDHGIRRESVAVAEVVRVIEEAWPAAEGLLSERLQREERLDARELG